MLDLKERPRKMAIIGGGYIAVEFAGIFNNYGTDVHLVYRQVGSSSNPTLFHYFARPGP